MDRERMLTDSHGVDVFTRWWPADDARAVVLLSHGASEHSGRYDRFAGALNDAGLAVAALDHRGHGRTGASSGRGVSGPGGGEALIDDLDELRVEALKLFGDRPAVLFGHSMGALIGLAYLTRHSSRLAGGILCGYPAGPDDAAAMAPVLQQAVEGGMKDQPMEILGQFNAPFEPARTAYDWLSRDTDEVDRYVADPMCGDGNPLTYGYFADLFSVVADARDRLDGIECPVLVIAGDKDPAAAMGAHATSLADALRAAGRDVELKLYADARHELLNETNRDEVTADVVRWLREHTG